MTTAIAYIRVSSTNRNHWQDEATTQLHAIRAYCEENGYDLVPTVCCDYGVSGTTDPSTRQGWSAVLGMLDTSDVIVVVTEAGRVARNSYYLESAISEVRSLGASLHDVVDGEYEDPAEESPEAWFQRQVMMLIPEFERRKIVQRLARGKARVKAEGGYTGGIPRISDEKRDRIMELATVGASMRAIANQVGVSVATVHKVVNQ